MTLTGAGERQTPDRALLMQRLRARARANGMADVIRHRLRVFTETTSPLIDYYRNRGIRFDRGRSGRGRRGPLTGSP